MWLRPLTLFGFLYKPTILNFRSYLVKSISSYLQGRMFEASFQTATHLVVACALGWHRAVKPPLSFTVCMLWSLYEDDRRRINATEMDVLRRSARTSKLDRKTNEYIRGKLDAQDTILDEITRKQLIWYGHVERMDPTRLPKFMIHWKPEGRKKRGRPRRTWKDGIFTAMNERDLRLGEWNDRRRWNMAAGRRRQTF